MASAQPFQCSRPRLTSLLDESNVLFLKLLGDYQGPDGCELLNGEVAKVLVDVKVLGRSVGYQIESNGSCPTVSPIGHLRYVYYQIGK